MFAWAPITAITDWLTTPPAIRAMMYARSSRFGEVVLRLARNEKGNGEDGGNNIGKHLTRYRGGRSASGSWCASFISYCIEMAEHETGRRTRIKRSPGARRLFRRCVSMGHRVSDGQQMPGDIVLWARGKEGSWQAHIGIVSRVTRVKGFVTGWDYIAGNEGHYPAVVRERGGEKKPRLIGFARLP